MKISISIDQFTLEDIENDLIQENKKRKEARMKPFTRSSLIVALIKKSRKICKISNIVL